MGWPYSFVSLNSEEVYARRILLDNYANVAQLSIIVPILLLQAVFLSSWLYRRFFGQSGLDTPSSPALKHITREGRSKLPAATVQSFLWWCGDECQICGWSVGTNGIVLGGIGWTLWLLLLVVLHTGNDYLHLTKRFGIVAASQLPLHYLLAIKTPYSPLQLLTRASHETLNAIHQAFGRIITLLFYLHAILYINFYVLSNLLAAKLKEAYVICGITGVILFTIIGISSLATVRKWNYRIFLAIHISLSVAILPILFFHVHHIRLYIYETLAIVVLNLASRALAAKSYSEASLKLLSDSHLVEISIPVSAKAPHPKWQAGQHAFISLPDQGLKAKLAKNPFTLASIPSVDAELRFVARIQSGNTARLARLAKSGTKIPQPLLVEGPYGLTTHTDTLLGHDRVLMIAGGVGGTFITPLYRQLLSDLSPSKGSYRRQKVSAVWIARSTDDVIWAVPTSSPEREGFLERLRVFVTKPDDTQTLRPHSEGIDDILPSATGDEGDGAIELEERANLLKKTADDGEVDSGGLHLFSGRPNIARIVEQAFSGGSGERVAVVVCGPVSLGKAVRIEVKRWVHKGRQVWFWNESFSL